MAKQTGVVTACDKAAMEENSIDGLHPTYCILASIVGLENALKLAQELGGTQVYIPDLPRVPEGTGSREAGGDAVDDLHPTHRIFVPIIGPENTLKLVMELKGLNLYIPKFHAKTAGLAKRIREEFDGRNYAELARKYKVSDTYVRKVLRQAKERET